MGFLFISGYRSQLMQIIFPFIICYSEFVKKVPAKVFFTVLIVGVILMIGVGQTRSGDEIVNDASIIFYLRDFDASNAALGFFVDEVNQHGITGGTNYVMQTLSVVPFLQSVLASFVDINSFASSSSSFFTNSFDTNGTGLGTNLIGDIYYTFGLFGVMGIMYVIGVLCSSLSAFKNKYYFLMYMIFIGNSVFFTRVELLYIVRMLSFGCIIFFLLNLLPKKLSQSHLR